MILPCLYWRTSIMEIVGIRTPFKIFHIVIQWIFIFMVYARIVIVIRYKSLSN